MLTSLSSRLPRRPRFYISILLFISFVVGLGHFAQRSQIPLSLNHFSWEKSLHYFGVGSRYYSWKTRPFFPPLVNTGASAPEQPDFCAGFPTHLLDHIQVVLKTGTGELAKNKAHLATVSSCITNLIVFSDLEEEVGHHHFIDVLANLSSSYAVDNPDFATYTAQKEAHSQGGVVGYSPEGWRLDRFKFLPMVENAYEMRPNASWYVFIEADVYYFWDTLFRLLDQLDPSEMHYMGSPVAGSYGRYFAYGGAGLVLSQGLMKRLVGDSSVNPRLSVRYETWVKQDCCGDAVLAYAILDKTGVKLEGLYPTFAGDELTSLRVDREKWCIPLLALHRVSPEQMASLWEWERTRPYNEKPFVHSTILAYTHSHLREERIRKFWDNYSDSIQSDSSPAHSSASACSSACTADSDCLQYSYSSKTCRFGGSIQMGKPMPDNEDFISGWDVEKMIRLGFKTNADFSDSCENATWLKPIIK